MQPLIPYLSGTKHPCGTRLVDYQKCIRTNDIDSIGDSYHHTFFEMLGNWSLGDYFKDDSITWSYEFLTKVLKMDVNRLAVTVFSGNEIAPFDEEAYNKWLELGISREHIAKTKDDNWWPNLEMPGLCGPDTEIFYFRSDEEVPKVFDPEDSRWVEIWNNVFMQYNHLEDGSIVELENKNVDTGMGVERVSAILDGVNDNYLSSIWLDTIKLIEQISNKIYLGNEASMRIIADHIRTSVFIAADKAMIKPSNVGQGYILRRLLRRAIRHAKKLEIDLNSNFLEVIANNIMDKYEKYYNEIKENRAIVIEVLNNEKIKFNHTLEKGLKEFNKVTLNNKVIDGKTAFHLFDTYGFPIELTTELASELNIKVDIKGFNEAFKMHQELSRTASSGQFKGGLGGHGEIETKYHTATHLLNAALKKIVGSNVHQMGSNINEERMRFDFSCDHKLTEEEKKLVEDLVNTWIKEDLEVSVCEMNKADAINSGAECMFIEKYPDIVTVYTIGSISKELCGGPHVKKTSEIGSFKIIKEEASSAGVRRIKATIE